MTAFFDYPKAAAFGRILPKNKIYENAQASAKLRQLFVDQVDQVVWQFKLAPETINLGATEAVTEIQIFSVRLRVKEFDEEILRAIDKAIPFPIVFELTHGGKRKVIAAYKRPNEADSAKRVISEYFGTDWEAEKKTRKPLPTALNLSALYDKLLAELLPKEAGTDEPIPDRVERLEEIRAKQREAKRIKARLDREKQFNKRVAINAELREVTNELENLGVTMTARD